ncbi:MAG: TnpV protein [Oscillospiraceae bacterium]|nr:TnpV protein [Clostridia bacterium]MBQ6895962.1 TnpV protein [Oscillospiraceae bacterium]
MKKFIYDEKNGLHYQLVGDYYLPCLKLNECEQEIGIWGQRHFEYIKKYKSPLYTTLLMTDKLYNYLVDVDKQAKEMYNTLIKQLAEKENVTEQLKAGNQMEWVSRMNNIKHRATEIVNNNMIHT